MLKYLRIAVTALGLTACGLITVLWVWSYWSLDVFIGRLSKTTAIYGTSSNGQLCLGTFSSPVGFKWTWKSTAQSPALLRLQKEFRAQLQLLEYRRSLALRHPPNDNATFITKIDQLTEQMDQMNFEFQLASGRLIQTRLWRNPTQFESQLVSEAALGFPGVSKVFGFGAKRGTNGWTVVCPHWCPVGVFGLLALAIGIGRRWRFSLRTLLIATTLVAVGLGMVVAAM